MRLVLLVLAACLAVPAAAAAEMRTGSVGDPRDTPFHENVDGSSRYEPFDIAAADVSYDTAGSIRIALRFYDPLPVESSERETYELSVGQDGVGGCYATEKGDLNLMFETPTEPLYPGAPTDGTSMLWLTEYEGEIPFTTELSPDRRHVVVAATHRALANRAYACVSEGTIGSSWSSGCNEYRCWEGGSATSDKHKSFRLLGPNGRPAKGRTLRLPTLSKAAAQRYVRTSLRRGFTSSFTYGYGYKRSCGRLSRVRVRCRVRWHVGDLTFSGPVTIWHSDDDGDVMWNYAWRIREVNGYCQVTRKRGCVKTHRVD